MNTRGREREREKQTIKLGSEISCGIVEANIAART